LLSEQSGKNVIRVWYLFPEKEKLKALRYSNMNINALRHVFKRSTRPQVITFTGGMGAQIVSAAIYFSLKAKDQAVTADLSYFDQPAHLAVVGNSGDCSHWPWQLHHFGIYPEAFEAAITLNPKKIDLISDGALKLKLGISALRNPQIKAKFPISHLSVDLLSAEFLESYLCIHIRRGDYVNVASHLVQDEQFLSIGKIFSGIFRNVVIVSDSPIPEEFRLAISNLYTQAVFLDQIDAFVSHQIMRNAKALICSNSQFSLIAALMNEKGLVILPRQWFGIGQQDLEIPIQEACDFQILRSDSI
jgi:hypothetical protein